MQFHEFAGIYPLLDDDKLQELADDIREHGLNDPIITFEDKILDGRNRMTACTFAGVEPHFKEFGGTRSAALAFVRSENYHRRHLDKGQRAACQKKYELQNESIAAQVATIKEAAKERQRKGGTEKVLQTFEEAKPNDRLTDAKRAAMAGTNRQYIHDADTLAAKAPDLLDEVAEGTKSMPQAKAELKERTEKKPSSTGAAALRAADKKRAFTAFGQLSKAIDDLRVRAKCDDALQTIKGVLERVK